MAGSRWLADEMVGRLARYLRFVGLDTLYARGLRDEEIVRRAAAEGRTLVTRDRALARRSAGAVLLHSPLVAEQWKELRSVRPDVPVTVRFVRCTKCNGELSLAPAPPPTPWPAGVPSDLVARGLPLYRCGSCGHLYWEGTHTAEIRRRIASWSKGEGAGP